MTEHPSSPRRTRIAAVLCALALCSACSLPAFGGSGSASGGSSAPEASRQPEGSSAPEASSALPSYASGVFSWDTGCLSGDARAKLYMALGALDASELYQELPEELSSDTVYDFLHDLSLLGVECWYLAGDSRWALDPEGASMLRRIAAAADYNEQHPDAPLAGIQFDVEGYLTEEWSEDSGAVMRSQLSAFRAAYSAAREYDLRMALCLPVWYDEKGYAPELTDIIESCCDELLLMNYGRSREYERIAFEVECARSCGKPVACVFEFQAPGRHGLSENETYHDLGVAAAVQSFEALYGSFGYPGLKLAYHYLDPLLELMNA